MRPRVRRRFPCGCDRWQPSPVSPRAAEAAWTPNSRKPRQRMPVTTPLTATHSAAVPAVFSGAAATTTAWRQESARGSRGRQDSTRVAAAAMETAIAMGFFLPRVCFWRRRETAVLRYAERPGLCGCVVVAPGVDVPGKARKRKRFFHMSRYDDFW